MEVQGPLRGGMATMKGEGQISNLTMRMPLGAGSWVRGSVATLQVALTAGLDTAKRSATYLLLLLPSVICPLTDC